MAELTVQALNGMDKTSFVDTLESVYETSPWVAERAASDRPFDSIEAVHESMRQAVQNASHDNQLELLQAHPDLGEQTEMTDASREEQASAGLDQLSREQYEAFQRLNETYRDTFGFPFIMAVKGASPDVIQATMEDRVDNSESKEFQTALDEVHEIARLRLDELLTS
ncbi:2-oxo-4-hydroxy-4-carboxy-5-ureidoimidazoline decarboxylase [Halohasta litchfieldiae]|jgi:2-oxo-4-hydroxy-4-carboxy-5-ureidoimidazoline decarboxylase|uniref:2-oxo-4-hydroxy-4-carboxy-5-ureidoimidazoline decarboxylase n=1 Tax=Halohasta litchfieldiae TaxID=1073996 RepID=A0A1H6S4S6_9EURY|nr:2-oxo-4-hydroxy-4-carboxy-5-ureidoimidazoline decarboxylase [Halohasta litchfieldiae]ATW89341.1 2-oxo-4-hydroxy-4-carboxy-5-ureidoimidazoline decarboxylase [Halohasta litchfieldiae]SEI59787.1 2-oxo-4-hydroxy-4-carboxy-5-ureidoimidazoline decarboxylase [Halohasta litchfieldiae]